MPMFVIERSFPGASQLTPEQLAEIAATSNAIVDVAVAAIFGPQTANA